MCAAFLSKKCAIVLLYTFMTQTLHRYMFIQVQVLQHDMAKQLGYKMVESRKALWLGSEIMRSPMTSNTASDRENIQ